MSKSYKIMGGFLLSLALLLSICVPALAATPPDLGRTGSITVTPTNGQCIGTELTLYCVADARAQGGDMLYVLTAEFAASGVDLRDLDDAATLAATLADYAGEKGLTGTTRAVAGTGSVTFTGLTPGLYLVIQRLAQPGGAVVNPFLVSVPVLNEKDEWEYRVDANPKAGTFELIDITVNKIWNDGGDTASRPQSVTVMLCKDGVALDTVRLSSENQWTYTWTGMAKAEGYSVKEAMLSRYAPYYMRLGNVFTVINTPKLAQTGQLNWPIPLLAGGGIVLFAVGWGLVFLNRRKDA